MKHPDREAWMSYLYEDDLDAAVRREMEAHRVACSDCRQQLQRWHGVQRQLQAWSLAQPRSARFRSATWVPLAAAALIFLSLGLALGRYGPAPMPDLTAWREELRQELRAEWAEQAAAETRSAREVEGDLQVWLADYAQFLERQRRGDLSEIHAALQQLDLRQQTETAELRRDLETVAVLTDASFRLAQDQMLHLASLPSTSPTPQLLEPQLLKPQN